MTTADLTAVDTVALGVPDNVGRLIGKRIPAERYEQVLRSGLPMPDFHLATGPGQRAAARASRSPAHISVCATG